MPCERVFSLGKMALLWSFGIGLLRPPTIPCDCSLVSFWWIFKPRSQTSEFTHMVMHLKDLDISFNHSFRPIGLQETSQTSQMSSTPTPGFHTPQLTPQQLSPQPVTPQQHTPEAAVAHRPGWIWSYQISAIRCHQPFTSLCMCWFHI